MVPAISVVFVKNYIDSNHTMFTAQITDNGKNKNEYCTLDRICDYDVNTPQVFLWVNKTSVFVSSFSIGWYIPSAKYQNSNILTATVNWSRSARMLKQNISIKFSLVKRLTEYGPTYEQEISSVEYDEAAKIFFPHVTWFFNWYILRILTGLDKFHTYSENIFNWPMSFIIKNIFKL